MKTKLKLEPGVKYRGYGYVNEYGELHFEASQPLPEDANRMKVVRCEGDITLYETKDNYKFAIKLPKTSDPVELYRALCLQLNEALVLIKTYFS